MSDSASGAGQGQGRTPKRARKACTECRQQKARCDAYQNSHESCSRCQRLGIQCVISEPFKREHKRKRLTQLEEETEALRRKLDASQTSTDLVNPHRQLPLPKQRSFGERNVSPVVPTLARESGTATSTKDNPPRPNITHHTPAETPEYSNLGTEDRVLDGYRVPGKVIDEIFDLYFTKYHRFLKILDPGTSPNSYYAESPLLFYSIIGTASRTFDNDSMLLYSLAPKIIKLALTKLQDRPLLSSVKAYLLLLTWPFPKGVHDSETSYALSGAMIHLAMQIGLHIPTSSQDFSRVKLKLSDEEIDYRCNIWARVVITYHRCCSYVGQNPMTVLDKSHDPEQVFHLTERLNPSLKFQLTLHRIEARCCDALLENGLRKLPAHRERTLDILLRVFEAQLEDLEPQAPTPLTKMCHAVTRLTVQMFHFYKEPNVKEAPAFARLYTSATRVLDMVSDLEADKVNLAFSPRYVTFAILLATTSLLRLLKSWFAQFLDYERAKAQLFEGIELAKYLSVGNKDTYTKLIPVLTQLWSSDKAFKRPDGTEFSALRIRSRLIMSPVADLLWWWREEFGGQAGAYPVDGTDNQAEPPAVPVRPEPVASYLDAAAFGDSQQVAFDWMQPYYFLDDQLLAEFGFNMNDPVAELPMNPSFGGWPQNAVTDGFNLGSGNLR